MQSHEDMSHQSVFINKLRERAEQMKKDGESEITGGKPGEKVDDMTDEKLSDAQKNPRDLRQERVNRMHCKSIPPCDSGGGPWCEACEHLVDGDKKQTEGEKLLASNFAGDSCYGPAIARIEEVIAQKQKIITQMINDGKSTTWEINQVAGEINSLARVFKYLRP